MYCFKNETILNSIYSKIIHKKLKNYIAQFFITAFHSTLECGADKLLPQRTWVDPEI